MKWKKILDKEGKEFPPRFPEQPIFYPVLNVSYAKQIAKEWNQKDSHSGFVGFVTEFDIDEEYIKKYEIHCVGDKSHQELWIPAEELEEFNKNIVGNIQIIQAFYGDKYIGIKPYGVTGFKEESIEKQIDILKHTLIYNFLDFSGTIFVEWKLINLNFLFWLNRSDEYIKVLESMYNCLLKNDKLFIDKDLRGIP